MKYSPIYDKSVDAINRVRGSLKDTAFRTYYSFHRSEHDNSVKILKSLSQDQTIIIIRPDKGNGIVLLDKTDYIDKINCILHDNSKFKIINEDWFKTIIKQEDKVNRFLTKLLKEKVISQEIYENLRLSGSQPGVLYGLPKIHKENVPLRPILSAIGTSGYKIAKFLLPFLEPLTSNQFTVKDSFSFVEEIRKIHNSENFYMASFDVKFLFTNVPLDETIDIAANNLYDNNMIVDIMPTSMI